jgi:diguanylate cyclase
MPVDEFLRWLAASESALVDETLLPMLSRGGVQA